MRQKSSFVRRTRGSARGLQALVLALALGACDRVDVIREYFRDPTPHEAYLLSLSQAGLGGTALGSEWTEASAAALNRPLPVELPFEEAGFFPAEEPGAAGYRFSLRRGQRLRLTVEVESAEPARVFVDLFRQAPDTLRPPVPVMWGDPGEELVFEPRRTGEYLVRVQPELLRDVHFTVRIAKEAALHFPVAGRSTRSIGSFFGDPREAGRREHHGVDIFAPRGTPVLAASEAYVSRVDTTPVGGRVIWLRDTVRRASLYYAHLDKPLVTERTRVRPGDTIGLVGNTGNARTTPPHLHFGLYLRGEGPVDPWDYLFQPPSERTPVVVDVGLLGEWVRIARDSIYLRAAPTRRSPVLSELPRHTALRVVGGVGSWFRVRLPDGRMGFVAGRLTEAARDPVRVARLAEEAPLRAAPLPEAPLIEEVPTGIDLPVLGTFEDYLFVRGPGGYVGWLGAGR